MRALGIGVVGLGVALLAATLAVVAHPPAAAALTLESDTVPTRCSPDGHAGSTWAPGNWCLRWSSIYGGDLGDEGTYVAHLNATTDTTVAVSIPLGGLAGDQPEEVNSFSGDLRSVEDNGRVQSGRSFNARLDACARGSNSCTVTFRHGDYPLPPPSDPPFPPPTPVWMFWNYDIQSANGYWLGWAEFAIKLVYDQGGPSATTQPPVASFTSANDPTTPGLVHFTSTSTDPGGLPLTSKWTFDDGSTSTADDPDHTFTTPGDHAVTLQVTNSKGKTDSVTKTVTVPAPTLSITASLPVASLQPGQDADVTLRVHAGTDGAGSLSGLTFTQPFASSDPSRLTVTSPPSPAPGTFSLAPGATKTFTATVHAVKSGDVDLTARVAGKDAIARSVSATLAAPVHVRSSALAITVTLSKPDLTLDEDADGPKPQTIDMEVDAKNTTAGTLTQVKLLPIQPSFQLGLPFTGVMPSAIVQPLDGPTGAGLDLPDLGPGQSATKTFKVKVLDDGHMRVGIDASYVDPDDANEIASGDAPLLSRPKYLLEFHASADPSVDDDAAEPWNTADAVAAERRYLVTGGLENLTTDQRIIAQVPVESAKQTASANLGKLEDAWSDPATPFVVQLDPGDSQGVQARPTAVPVPGKNGSLTFSEVTYGPGGKAELHDDDGELKDITAAQVLTTDDQRSLKVPIVWPPPQPAPTPIEFYGLYSKAFIESSAAWWANAARTAGDALAALGEVEHQGWLLVTDPAARAALRQRLTGAWASFVNTIDLARATIASLSPAERLQLIADITNPLVLFLKASHSLNTTAKAAYDTIAAVVGSVLTRITTLGGEDPRELARILGSGSAVVLNEVTVGMVSDSVFASLIGRLRYSKNLAAAQEFVDEAAKAKAAAGLRVDKGLKGIPSGALITDEVLTIGLGVTRAEKQQIQAVAKRFNLVVMARSRGSGAVKLIEKGLARLKPFGIDAKNVNDIDRLLGFPSALKDTVALKKPLAWERVVGSAEYQALDAEQRAQVAARWQTRSKEWSGGGKLKQTDVGDWVVSEAPPANGVGAERQKFLDAAKAGSFDLQFPTKGNWEEVAVDGSALGTARAKFSLRSTTNAVGEEVLQPLMSDARGGKLLPITGDVDLVALLNPDGTYPETSKIIAAYMELAKPPLRMQHPATWSFNVQGKSMDLLADHVLGGATAEPLAAFDPTGKISAVLFDPKMSLIPGDRASNPALLLHVAGGVKLPSHAYGLGALVPFSVQADHASTPYYVPEQWEESLHRVDLGTGRTVRRQVVREAPSTAGVRFVRGAVPTEEAADLSLVRLGSDGRWQPWTPPATGKLEIAPQTCITDRLASGGTTVGVYSLAKLFEVGGTGGQQWFAPGDSVVVDPDSGDPWTTTIAAVGDDSITFADPAPRAFLPGTAVHLAASQSGGEGTEAGPGELPRTGTDPAPATVLALVLIAFGATLVYVGGDDRRRRRRGRTIRG